MSPSNTKAVPTPLSPTLWRTCRALANRKRLCLLRHVFSAPGIAVSSAAKDLGWPVPLASQYLRTLNARGLLRATRQGREVCYEAGPDPSLPETAVLLPALQAALGRRANPVDAAFRSLTAFTHPRRIILVRALSTGAGTLGEIRKRTGIPLSAAQRHLRKLRRRGFVAKNKDRYVCRHPPSTLARALMNLALLKR